MIDYLLIIIERSLLQMCFSILFSVNTNENKLFEIALLPIIHEFELVLVGAVHKICNTFLVIFKLIGTK